MNNVLVTSENAEPPSCLDTEGFVCALLEKLGIDGVEVSILFCNDDTIQTLNRDYRGLDEPTDVLSFENGDTYSTEAGATQKIMGDIAISLDTLKQNALFFETDEVVELKRLLIHAILHLNGMDHGDEHLKKDEPPTCPMLVLQEKLLKEL